MQRHLPDVPSLEHLKNQAKTLFAAYRDGDEEAVAEFDSHHPQGVSRDDAQLTDAQLVLARSYKQLSWRSLKRAVQVRRQLHDADAPRRRQPPAPNARVHWRNAQSFLRAHAPGINVDDLRFIQRQFGGAAVFHYQDDKVIKVPKNGSRKALPKEAALYEYLNRAQDEFEFPQPLFVHDESFYAVFTVIEGESLDPETIDTVSASFIHDHTRSIARFFRWLHTHSFPDEILQLLERADDPYDVHLGRVRRKLQFVAKHSNHDTAGWAEQLDQLAPSLTQRWVVTHLDPQLGHFFAIDGDPNRLGVIDMMDAGLHDPGWDLGDFALELHSDLDEELATSLVDTLLAAYETDAAAMADKIAYTLLEYEIRVAYRNLRRQIREAAKGATTA